MDNVRNRSLVESRLSGPDNLDANKGGHRMTNGFTKLFNSIITSSIWSEDNNTRIMWITMLASADATGYVTGSIPGMAAVARMSLEDAEQSIKALCKPDPYSRSKEYEGRRLLECEGGWLITNYVKYRQKRDPEKRKEQNRDAKRKQRAKQKISQCQQDVSQSQPKSAKAEAEAEADNKDIRQKSNDFRLAELLLNLICERKPDFRNAQPDRKEKTIEKWAIHVDRMIRLDNRKPERIEKVIRWCQADSGNGNWSGWQNNILSTEALRKQFDTLELRMGSNGKRNETVPFDEGAAAQREKQLVAAGAK